MIAVWAFLKGIPLWVWLGLALLAGGLYYGHVRFEAGQADVQAKFDQHLEADKVATAKFNAETKAKEAAQAEKLAQVGFQYERDKAHALDQKDRVIADLRSGAVSLRPQWRCPASPMPDTPGSTQAVDDAADLREADAGSLVSIAAACDAHVRGLQAILTKERE